MHSSRTARWFAGVVLPFAVLAVWIAFDRGETRHAGPLNRAQFGAGKTLPQARNSCGPAVSLDDLQKVVPYSIVLPDTSAATAKTVVGAYRCTSTEAMIQFSSGVTMYLDETTVTDPTKSWQNVVDQNAGLASIVSVDGLPALLLDPAKDPTSRSKGSLTFVRDGTWINIVGNGQVPSTDFIAVANSLTPR